MYLLPLKSAAGLMVSRDREKVIQKILTVKCRIAGWLLYYHHEIEPEMLVF